jgi:capsule biosynthesis protein
MKTNYCSLFVLSWILALWLLPSSTDFPVENHHSTWPSGLQDSVDITIAITGDIMQHESQIASAACASGGYDYTECFRHVAPYLREADFTIGNLELTLGGKPYKGYPCFSAPDSLLIGLKWAGFNVLTTANNHCCDRRNAGIIRTITKLDSAEIQHTGTFKDSSDWLANSPLILEKSGKKIAILAYTYGTNGIPFSPPTIVNIIDTSRIINDIRRAKKLADATIVAMHWGEEYRLAPNKQQLKMWQILMREGVTAVIGNHPHVLQPLAFVADSTGSVRQFCAFSLGNFISAQRTYPRAGAAIIKFTLSFNPEGVAITNGQYLLTYVERQTIYNGQQQYVIMPLESVNTDSSGMEPNQKKFVTLADDLFGGGWGIFAPMHRRVRPPFSSETYSIDGQGQAF